MSAYPFLGVRHAALVTSDLKSALAFYRDHLGFVDYHVGDEDWAMLSLGGTSLSLVRGRAHSERPPGSGHGAHLGILLADLESVDRLHASLVQKKISKVGRPVRHRDGSYGFYLRDLDDNALEVIFIPLRTHAAPGSDEAWILVAHGSEDPKAREPFQSLLRDLAKHVPDVPCALAFLEFGGPDLAGALREVFSVAREVRLKRVRVFPVFWGAGGHGSRELPALVDVEKKRYPELSIGLEPPLGESPWVREGLLAAVVQGPRVKTLS